MFSPDCPSLRRAPTRQACAPRSPATATTGSSTATSVGSPAPASQVLHRVGHGGPGTGPRGITAFVVHADDEGFTLGAEENKLGIKGSPTRELYFDNVRLPADRMIGEVGEAGRSP